MGSSPWIPWPMVLAVRGPFFCGPKTACYREIAGPTDDALYDCGV